MAPDNQTNAISESTRHHYDIFTSVTAVYKNEINTIKNFAISILVLLLPAEKITINKAHFFKKRIS
jgi:hypothetical protein